MDIDLRHALKLLRTNLAFILVVSLVCMCSIGLISAFVLPKKYISVTKLYVSTPTSDNTAANLNELNYAQKVVNTYIEMLDTNSFYEKVADKTQLGLTAEKIARSVSFSVRNDTEVFQAQVTTNSPTISRRIADAIAALAPATISELREDASLRIVDAPLTPERPSSPNTPLNTVIGFLLGFAATFGTLLLVDRFDVRIKNEEDITSRYDIPVLASIPNFDLVVGKPAKKKGRSAQI